MPARRTLVREWGARPPRTKPKGSGQFQGHSGGPDCQYSTPRTTVCPAGLLGHLLSWPKPCGQTEAICLAGNGRLESGTQSETATRLAPPVGLEPTTSWSEARRSIQLSYRGAAYLPAGRQVQCSTAAAGAANVNTLSRVVTGGTLCSNSSNGRDPAQVRHGYRAGHPRTHRQGGGDPPRP